MPYATRSCAVIDFFAPIVCHVIQREYRYNMVSIDAGDVYKVIFFIQKLLQRNPIQQFAWGTSIIIMM